jgi:hypothetical protein
LRISGAKESAGYALIRYNHTAYGKMGTPFWSFRLLRSQPISIGSSRAPAFPRIRMASIVHRSAL